MIEDQLRGIVGDAVRSAVAPLAVEVSALRRALDSRDRWISRVLAAERLGVSLDTVDRAIANGTIRAQRLGRAVRIDATSLVPPSADEIVAMAREARR